MYYLSVYFISFHLFYYLLFILSFLFCLFICLFIFGYFSTLYLLLDISYTHSNLTLLLFLSSIVYETLILLVFHILHYSFSTIITLIHIYSISTYSCCLPAVLSSLPSFRSNLYLLL